MVKFSIIIPAHNAAKTISKAIDSARFRDSEILVVENGSTDQTSDIVKAYTEKYDNIYLYHSSKGVSQARNLGIEKAQGKWLLFLDADDYFLPVERQAFLSIEGKDIIFFNYEKNNEPVNVTDEFSNYQGKSQIIPFIGHCLTYPTKYLTVWGKLFSRQLMTDNNLRFNTELEFSEDSEFLVRYLQCCQTVQVSPLRLYHYSLDSVSTVRSFKEEKLLGYLQSIAVMAKSLEEADSELEQAFEWYKLAQFNLMMVHDVYHPDNGLTRRESIQKMVKLSQESTFSSAFKLLRLRDFKRAAHIPLLFIKHGFYHLAALVYQLRIKQNNRKGKKAAP